MREIYYNSDITPKATNEIKLLALYYDKINIVNDAVYTPKFEKVNGKLEFKGSETLQFIPKSFLTDYKLLLDENVIAITKRDENEEDKYEQLFAKKISTLVNSERDIIFPKHPTEKDGRIINEEVYDIMKHMVDFEWGKPIEENFVWWYYSFKLKWFLKLLMEGKNCLSSSDNLNALFSKFIQESVKSNDNLGTKGYTKSLAFDALKISLPNPDILSFEDILELKLKLKDELGLFYQTINAIEVKNKQLFNSDLKNNEYEGIFFSEIQKPLNDLEIKMKNLNSKTFRKFIDKMQNPKTYVPLIGTVVASAPIHYAVLASLGLITGQSYLEYKEEKKRNYQQWIIFLIKVEKLRRKKMNNISIIISSIALLISGLTFWITRLKKGVIKMTRPTTIFFGPDGDGKQRNKIFIRTLLYSTSERGQYIQNMFIRLQRGESVQNFNVWAYGERRELVRGSGLFINKNGIALNHHFLQPKDGTNYEFNAGDYLLSIFIETVDQPPIKIFEQALVVNKVQQDEMSKKKAGLFFDWAPNTQNYFSHIDIRQD